MSYAHHYDTIVLRTVDVGEADRFCILFTRERGRLAARARGARRPHSRMGSALLPLHRALVSVKELSGGGLVTAALPMVGGIPSGDLSAFFRAECGIEILLALLHDEQPLPDLFDATAAFLARSAEGDHIIVAFALRTLHILGLLPDTTHVHPSKFSLQERAFIDASRRFPLCAVPAPPALEKVRSFCAHMLKEQLSYPLHGQYFGTTKGSYQNTLSLCLPAVALAKAGRERAG
ncbi:recombination protein O N-terminal domain-containing protein [Candidatus Peregrinibacteria bacterium]|nr:recombination protein O N-terminal domain-containing protein [Candidatus Peregrinibacteria bacterium]